MEHFKFMQFAVCFQVFNVQLTSLAVPLDDDSLVLQPLITSGEAVSSAGVRQLMKSSVVNHPINRFESLPSVNKEQVYSPDPRVMSFKGLASLKEASILETLPDVCSNAWKDGLIWKGVFFKLVSRVEGKELSARLTEMRKQTNGLLDKSPKIQEDRHRVCFEPLLYTLSDLGSYFLFASPVIKSIVKSGHSVSSTLSWNSVLGQETKAELEGHIFSNSLQKDEGTRSILSILISLKSTSNRIQVIMSKKDSLNTDQRPTVVTLDNIDHLLTTAIPAIGIDSIKNMLGTVISKGYKGFSMDSIRGLISQSCRVRRWSIHESRDQEET